MTFPLGHCRDLLVAAEVSQFWCMAFRHKHLEFPELNDRGADFTALSGSKRNACFLNCDALRICI